MTKKKPNTGYVYLWRKIWDNPIGKKPIYLAIFLYLVSHANHKDKDIIWNNKRITIKRGSFVGSMAQIAKYFDISVGTVSYILDYFISERMIEKQSNFKFTVFTILNYECYQSTESYSESKLKASKKQAETTNNDNNDNNDNNNIYIPDKKKTHSEIESIYTSYKNLINQNSRLTKAARDKIRVRLKTYSIDDLLKAMANFSQDEWWMEHNAFRGVAWFFNSDDRIDQFLNIKPKKKSKWQ
jgi:hypothetical protein